MSVSTSSCWDKVPCEILQTIFEFTKQRQENHVSDLKSFQLVCKSWNKVAQGFLYKSIYLDEENVSKFVYTIHQNCFLGTLVKKLTICDGFARTKNAALILELITDRCPRITEIYAINKPQKMILWSHLASKKSKLKHVQLLNKQNEDNEVLCCLYTHVALKYKDTITHLQVFAKNSCCALYSRYVQRFLLLKLPLFKSLRHLRVVRFEQNQPAALNWVIDLCHRTVNSLHFDALCLSQELTLLPHVIKQNTSITKLVIGYADIPATCIQYLSYKLQALETLQITSNTRFSNINQELEWWKQLEILCLPLRNYCILADLVMLERAEPLLRQTLSINNRKLILSTSNAPVHIYFSHNLALLKRHDAVELSLGFLDVQQFQTTTTTGAPFASLSLYSPNNIKITAENMDEFYDRFTTTRNPPYASCSAVTQNTSQHHLAAAAAAAAAENITHKIRRFLSRECNQRNWCAFNAVTHLISQSYKNCQAYLLHFDRMVLCDSSPKQDHAIQYNLEIAELQLTNSILYFKVFPEIGKRLPSINTLIIDTCSILMDECFSLKIFLPCTRVSKLHLKIMPFLNATACGYGPNETSNLENEDLLRVLATDGHILFKIETDTDIYTLGKQGDKVYYVEGSRRRISTGCRNEFLIWVKCRDLAQLVLESNNKPACTVWKR